MSLSTSGAARAEPQYRAGQLIQLRNAVCGLRAGSLCRVVKVLRLNSAQTGVEWFRYVVALATPNPRNAAVIAPCWESDLSPVPEAAAS
jgi:hypothetical protein